MSPGNRDSSDGGDSLTLLKKYLEDSTTSSYSSLCRLCHGTLSTASPPTVSTILLSTILLPCESTLNEDVQNSAVHVCLPCQDVTAKLAGVFTQLQLLRQEFCNLRDEVGRKLIFSFTEVVGLQFADTLEKWNSMQKDVQHIYPHLIKDHIQIPSKVVNKVDPDAFVSAIDWNAKVKVELDDVDQDDPLASEYPESFVISFDEDDPRNEFDLESEKNDVKLSKMTPTVVVERLSTRSCRTTRSRLKRPKIYISSDDEDEPDPGDNEYLDAMSSTFSASSDSDGDVSSSPPASPTPLKSRKPRPKSKSVKSPYATSPRHPLKCSHCPKTFPKLCKLKQHEKMHFSDAGEFSCSHCDSSFADPRAFHRHHLNTHLLFSPLKDFKCPFCLKRYDQYHTRNRHILEIHGVTLQSDHLEKDVSSQFLDDSSASSPSIHCYFCLNKPAFSTVAELLAHEDSAEHKEVILLRINIHCALCTIKFTSVEELKEHLNSSLHLEEVEKYSSVDKLTFCIVCKQSFDSKKALITHKDSSEHRKAYEDAKYKMNGGFLKPRESRPSKTTGVNKSISNEGSLSYECSKCGKTFARNHGLMLHMTVVHADDGYACEFCGKTFTTSGDFKSHRRSHLSEIIKPFQCDKCEKSFLNKRTLENHLQVHEGLTHQCEQCGKTFLGLVFMKKHVKFSHPLEGQSAPQYSSKCSECPEVYSKSDQLRKHMVTTHPEVYLKDKPFYCKVCYKRYLTEEEIENEHMAAHDAHKCKFCGKYFRFKKGLDKHLRVHTKERPYICTICSKGFMTQDNLKEHTLRHTGERPHKCDVCGKGFIRSGEMKKHREKCRKKMESL